MRPRHLIFLLVLLTIFAACNGEERPTPTPFGPEGIGEETPPAGATLEISISDLATDPEAYANTRLEITGKYRRLPLLVCENDPHPSPATWQLVAEDGSIIALGGFDSQVRTLLPNNLTVTVSGVWQLFEGPVGCGKDATGTQIWYLKVSDILSPSPIARVTLTPTGSGSQIADNGEEATAVSTPDEQGNLPPTATLTNGTAPASNGTPTSPSTSVPSLPGSGTATSTPTLATGPGGPGGPPTDTPDAAQTPDPDGTNTATPGSSGGATNTPAPSGGSVTPTSAGSGNPTPTSAALSTATNPNDFAVVEFDELDPETPILEYLGMQEAHLWPILLQNNGAITVTAVAQTNMNIVVEIVDSGDDVVQQANNGGNGVLETIVNAQLNPSEDYKIRIYEVSGSAGNYCFIFNEAGGFPDSIKGRIAYGQTINNTLEVLGIDYWCFMGTAGDNITITAELTGTSGDLAIGLFGPPTFAAIGDVFAGPELADITLAEDGMFIVGVLDFDSQKVGYSLVITEN